MTITPKRSGLPKLTLHVWPGIEGKAEGLEAIVALVLLAILAVTALVAIAAFAPDIFRHFSAK